MIFDFIQCSRSDIIYMFKKLLANTTSLWLLALIIIIEGLILANLELAPAPSDNQPAVLGVRTESAIEFFPEQLSPAAIIDEIKNKIQQKIDLEPIENQATAVMLNNSAPFLAEEKSANEGQSNKKEATVNKTEEQLKIEEINNILNQSEPKINLKKYQPALEEEIFNPIKELIKKNLEIFKSLTE